MIVGALKVASCETSYIMRYVPAVNFTARKVIYLFFYRNYCQKVATLAKESDSVFDPTANILARADKEFQFLGLKAALQGSFLKTKDAVSPKLPEVLSFQKLTSVKSKANLKFSSIAVVLSSAWVSCVTLAQEYQVNRIILKKLYKVCSRNCI